MRVAVAMSGGVDSSVAAALLVDAGHDVVGVSMRICGAEQGEGRAGTCCTIEDLHDARRVARQLGIPHYMVDLGRRFDEIVIGDFVAEYARGRTPIPCAHCNSELKFAALVEQAIGLEAARIATGHYARVTRDDAGVFHLWRGADDRKDQAYFLFALASPWGWTTVACPLLMLYFLFRVTGIPATEAQALRTKGEDYREYQRTTSAFVPWPRGARGGGAPPPSSF